MKRIPLLPIVGVLLAAGASALAVAQDPFGDGNPFAAAPDAPPAAPAAPAAAPAAPAAPDPAALADPVVAAILLNVPNTPNGLVRAARDLLNYGRPDEAKAQLKRLLDSRPSPAALAAVHREFGSGLFFQWLRDPRIQPEGLSVAQSVLRAASEAAIAPARLDQLVRQLGAPAPAQRLTAMQGLREAGPAAASALLKSLADPDRSAEHAAARQVLINLGAPVVEPLIAALDAPGEEFETLKRNVVATLAFIESSRSAPYLAALHADASASATLRQLAGEALQRVQGAAPGQPEVARFLYDRAKEYYGGRRPGVATQEGLIELWAWKDAESFVVPRLLSADDASLVVAADLAERAYRLAPRNPDYRAFYLLTLLDERKTLAGWSRPLSESDLAAWQTALSFGVEAAHLALVQAMKQDRPHAAIGAVEILGALAAPTALATCCGANSTLVSAAIHPDRRLQFAASQAIALIDPTRPFAGASHYFDRLTFFARSGGQRQVLVAHPLPIEAETMAGFFSGAGFDAQAVYNGRALVLTAATRPDVEFILASEAIDHPPIGELVQWLRREPATAGLPIAIVARPGQELRSQAIADLHPKVTVIATPRDDGAIAFVIRRMRELAGRTHLEPEERMAQAADALRWLGRYARHADVYSFYEYRKAEPAFEMALMTPELAHAAAAGLGFSASANAQKLLVDVASEVTLPASLRQAAADAFALAVQRRGVLLTNGQTLAQYDRYNRSETLDRATQQILGQILDIIEGKPVQASLEYPPTAVPAPADSLPAPPSADAPASAP